MFDPSKPFEVVEEKTGFDPSKPFETIEDNGLNANDARTVAFQRSALLGTRPTVAGIGAGLGAASSKLFDEGKGLSEAYNAGKEAFSQSRDDEIALQNELEKQYPSESLQGTLGGAVLTAPLTTLKGIKGALGLGALTGTGEAIGSAKNLKEAGADIASGTVGGGIGYGVGKGIGAAGSKAKELMEYLGNKFGNGAYNLSSKLTGLPLENIKTYTRDTDEVNKIIKASQGDLQGTVDTAKENITNAVFGKKRELSNQISEALKNAPKEKNISLKPVTDELNKIKSQFDPVFQKDQISSIDDMLNLIKQKSPTGEVDLQDLFAIQKDLQKKSAKGFVKNGEFFAQDQDVARAAKGGYGAARDITNEYSNEIKNANNLYSQLHDIDEVAPTNLLKQGSNPGVYYAAGSGENVASRDILKQLSDLTGKDLLTPAKQISSANVFKDPTVIPYGNTGKTFTNAALGYGLGEALGDDGKEGGFIGASLTSPFVLKQLLQGKNLASKAGPLISRGVESVLESSIPTRLGSEFSRDKLFEMLEEKKVNNPAIKQYVGPEKAKEIYLQQNSGN